MGLYYFPLPTGATRKTTHKGQGFSGVVRRKMQEAVTVEGKSLVISLTVAQILYDWIKNLHKKGDMIVMTEL